MTSPPQLDTWLGQKLGAQQRYRLDKRLGDGGMGDVFLATDTLLGQSVALKLLKERLAASGELRKRFEHEVAICAALKSEHIVQVSDYGLTAEGHPFYVMEYLCGQTLGQLLRQKKSLSPQRTAAIISQVCTGLHLAHTGINLWCDGASSCEYIKVVHRDLKPDNIFLVPTALGELVKILDFGIAKIRRESVGNTVPTSVFLGTFHYAAPEQFEVGNDLDERADIYSLGMILYEMLTSTDPFGIGSLAPKPSGVAWIVAHTSKQPQPLRMQPGCEHLSLELEAVVMRCLQKAPEQRFSSVHELKVALQAAVFRLGDRPQSSSQSSASIAINPNATASTVIQHTASDDSKVTYRHEILSHFFYRKKHPLRLVKATLSMIVGLGIFYASPLSISHLPIVQKVQPIVQEPKFSLANSLSKHLNSVWSVAISPNGQTLASGSLDKTVKIWNLGDGELLHTLSGHSDAVRTVTISSSGQLLASGSVDRTIKIWHLPTKKLLRTLSGHLDPVWSVAISPNEQFLASSSYDGIIKIWHLPTGKLLHTLSEHSDSVWSVAISPDGQTLVSGSKDKTIKVWNLKTGELLRTLSGHSDSVRAVAISSDGQTLISGSWDNTIKVWNLETGELQRTFSGHTNRVISIAISPSGQIASGSLDKTIQIWNLNGQVLRTLSGHSDWVISVAFSPDGQTLVSGSKDKTIKIWR